MSPQVRAENGKMARIHQRTKRAEVNTRASYRAARRLVSKARRDMLHRPHTDSDNTSPRRIITIRPKRGASLYDMVARDLIYVGTVRYRGKKGKR